VRLHARHVVAEVRVVERVEVERVVPNAGLRLAVTYAPTANGLSPPTGTQPYSCRYSIASRSDQLSPIAPPCWPPIPLFGPATMRWEIMCVYSWPITVMS
jgi:hypothetical protein